MNHRNLQLISVLAVFTAVFAMPVDARIKCWTNKDGFRECGSYVPPEYAQEGHQELSNQGVVVEEQDRAKTNEELAEEARIAAIEAEKERVREEKEKQDRILLDTFTSVGDIELSRTDTLNVIESTITLTEKRIGKIQEDLEERLKAAAAAERRGKAPDKVLLEEIESLRRQIKNNENFISQKQQEKEAVNVDFDAKVARFKALTGT